MANIDIEQRPKGNILPWLVGLAILVAVVGWLLWQNNRIPDVQGRLEVPMDENMPDIGGLPVVFEWV